MVYIYILIDPITNKIRYVGQSTTPKVRYRDHINYAKRNNDNYHVYNWIRKLLNDNKKPILKIIETCENYSKANEYEKKWIKHYKDNGENLTNIFNGGNNYPLSELFKEKLSNIIPNKPVLQYDLNGNFIREFKGISYAKKLTKVNKIIDCCKLRRKSAGGFQWRYKEDNKFLKKIKKYTPDTTYFKSLYKPVLQYDLDGNFIKEYYSLSEAAKSIGKYHPLIRMCCILKNKSAYSFQWRYKNGDDFPRKIEKIFNRNVLPVLQYDLDGNFIKEFKNLSDIKEFDTHERNIDRVCMGLTKSSKNFQWKYKNGVNIKKKINPCINENIKPVLQYDLDRNFIKEFVNITVAGNDTNTNRKSITNNCLGRQKSAGGFQWKYR